MEYWIWTLIIAVIIYLLIRAYEFIIYFKKYGVPQPLEVPFLGTLGLAMIKKQSIYDMLNDLYYMNPKAKYVGFHIFGSPAIMIRDTELLKSVLVKDFDNFAYHTAFFDEVNDPLFSKNISSLNGEKWREIRNILSPAFTSSKMRTMHLLISRCAKTYSEQFFKLYMDSEAIDLKDAFTRYTNDVIATCAFGIEVNSLQDPKNDFYMTGKRVTALNTGKAMITFILVRTVPKLAHYLGLRVISKRDNNFFINIVQSTIKAREEQGIKRPDMLQLMIDAAAKSSGKSALDLLEITAQAMIFFFGGFETTSGQACLIAHELAVNPDIQRKLQGEIDAVMLECNGEPDYEMVNKMPYMDAIFTESLRKYPLPSLNRMCSKTFELPPALPDSEPYVVQPGMELVIPAYNVHYDKNYYENPEKFDPERFLNTKRATHSDATTLGFGLGPRVCLGNRFAILEIKILFIYLLSKCNIVPCKKSCIPFEYDTKYFMPFAKGGFWFKVEPRNKT